MGSLLWISFLAMTSLLLWDMSVTLAEQAELHHAARDFARLYSADQFTLDSAGLPAPSEVDVFKAVYWPDPDIYSVTFSRSIADAVTVTVGINYGDTPLSLGLISSLNRLEVYAVMPHVL